MTTESIALAGSQPRDRGWRFGALGFVVALAFAVVLVAGFLAGLAVIYQNRVMPGVTVAGVPVAGMDRAAAEAALRAGLPPLSDGEVTLTVDDETVTLPYASVARDYDMAAMLDAAFQVGRGGTVAEQSLDRVRSLLRGSQVTAVAGYDQELARSRLLVLATTLARDPVDASISLPEGSIFFTVSPAVAGRALDVPATLAVIDPLLASADAGAVTAPAVTQPVEAAVSTPEAQAAATQAGLMTASDLALTAEKKTFKINNETLRTWVAFGVGADGAIAPTLVDAKIAKAIKGIAKKVDQAGTNARYRVVNGRPSTVIPSKPGRSTDQAASVLAVKAALSDPALAAAPVALAVASSEPAFTTADAKAWRTKLKPIRRARWTTHFPQGERNFFGKNISIPTSLINGYVVAPGEWFDFWDVVGEISRARGFGPGGAIINGRTEPTGALAGGICSCSTTLFNAALRYGLEMGDRRNHYYYIDRYPLGLDATVFKSGGGSVQSMSFKNDTESPIMIRGWTSFGIVNFQLWSVDSGRRVSFSRPTVRNIRPAGWSIQYTSSLVPGRRQTVEYPATGKDVWVTRFVRDRNGKLLDRQTFYSHYARITGITLVGRGSADSH